MSLIGAEDDELKSRRSQSMRQEAKIDRAAWVMHWRSSDATKTLVIERVFAVFAMFLFLVWFAFFCVLSFGLFICMAIFSLLGRIFR